MAYSSVRPVGCYVYTHRKATTGQVFYVGKGTAERAWDRYGRNVYWQRIAAKHGFTVQIESEGLLEFEAHAQERELIAKLRAEGVRLANLTDGGEGTLNPSAETRKKISDAHRGKKVSQETRAKMSASLRGKVKSEATREKLRQRVYTQETRDKMRESGKACAPISEETAAKLRAASRAKWSDPEYRAKVKAGTTGKKRDAAFAAKMSLISRAKAPMTEEEKRQTRQTMLQKWEDPEYRERMSKAHAGKPWTEKRREAYLAAKARKAAGL